MPMEIGAYHGGDVQIVTFTDSLGYQRFTIDLDQEPDSVILDPYRKVLCEKTRLDNIDDVPDPGITESRPVSSLSLAVDNIVSDVMHIRFSQPGNDQVTVSLFDASGRLVRNYYAGQSRDFYRVYPVADLSPGVYFVHVISSDGSQMSAKTVKIR
jgi:hypothetical protein